MTITRLAQLTAETRVLTDISFVFSGSASNIPSISSAQAKTGTYSYLSETSCFPWGFRYETALTALRIGFSMYMVNSAFGEPVLYRAGYSLNNDDTDDHIRLQFDTATGLMYLRRPVGNNTFEDLVSATIPAVFSTTGTWFHVGITHKIHASDGFFTLYINGVEALTYQGDTRSCRWDTSLNPDAIVFSSDTIYGHIVGRRVSSEASFTEVHVDDIYVDSMVGELDSVVPSRRFLMVLPTGVGADAAWTPVPVVANYLNVDDNPNDGDVSYNKAVAAGLRDTFAMGDIVLPVDHRIVAVIPSPFAKRLDSAFASQVSVHAWDGLTYLDSADLDLSMSYDVPVFARFELQPDGSEWNETDFNAMQLGYRSRGAF